MAAVLVKYEVTAAVTCVAVAFEAPVAVTVVMVGKTDILDDDIFEAELVECAVETEAVRAVLIMDVEGVTLGESEAGVVVVESIAEPSLVEAYVVVFKSVAVVGAIFTEVVVGIEVVEIVDESRDVDTGCVEFAMVVVTVVGVVVIVFVEIVDVGSVNISSSTSATFMP